LELNEHPDGVVACSLIKGLGESAGPRRTLLVTVPVRNEEPRIRSTIDRLTETLSLSEFDYTLAVAEDGSTDGTKRVLENIVQEFPSVMVASAPSPLGRGLALRRCWPSTRYDVYVFTDADLAAGTETVLTAARQIQSGTDLAVGSRFIPGSVVNRPPLRNIVSRIYNWGVRQMFGDGVYDHQCGLKAFSNSAVQRLFPLCQEDSWFWDTEVIVLAKRLGLGVYEIPVRWTETKTQRTPLMRLLSDIILHGTGLLRVKARLDSLGMVRAFRSGYETSPSKSIS
jgi:glycosyltransferase involved in cell wall biosynthesis